jgi:hypothetical protein
MDLTEGSETSANLIWHLRISQQNIYSWFSNVLEKNASINGPFMYVKAEKLAKTMVQKKVPIF